MSKRIKQEDFTPLQWADYYDGLAQKNYMNYQSCGEPRFDRAQYKYEKIAEAFRAKATADDEWDADIKKRMVNCQGVIDRLIPGKTYSKDEVEKMLREAVWW